MRKVDKGKLESDIRRMLVTLGVNFADQHFRDTPRRMAESYMELTRGMAFFDEAAKQKLRTVFRKACTKDGECQNLITLCGKFSSLCAHHFLPFRGIFALSYIPHRLNIGASKVPRLFDYFGPKPQGQELLIHEIADEFEAIVQPRGLAVWCGGIHDCMLIRGPKASGSWMETRLFRGIFSKDQSLQSEFTAIVASQRLNAGTII